MSEAQGQPCVCGSGQDEQDCCMAILSGQASALTAEALMRSRYFAYVNKHADYLVKTCHKDYRQETSKKALEDSFKHTHWLSLQVLKSFDGKPTDRLAQVEFKAFYKTDQQQNIMQLHELSNFVQEDGKWFYTDAGFSKSGKIDLGRNDNCWCGSQRKFKKCHG